MVFLFLCIFTILFIPVLTNCPHVPTFQWTITTPRSICSQGGYLSSKGNIRTYLPTPNSRNTGRRWGGGDTNGRWKWSMQGEGDRETTNDNINLVWAPCIFLISFSSVSLLTTFFYSSSKVFTPFPMTTKNDNHACEHLLAGWFSFCLFLFPTTAIKTPMMTPIIVGVW